MKNILTSILALAILATSAPAQIGTKSLQVEPNTGATLGKVLGPPGVTPGVFGLVNKYIVLDISQTVGLVGTTTLNGNADGLSNFSFDGFSTLHFGTKVAGTLMIEADVWQIINRSGAPGYFLPTTDGLAGQVSRTNGAGVAAWTGPVMAGLFGGGVDGNATVNVGTTTLTRDMFYNNLTVSGTGNIATNGWKIYVNGLLTVGPAASITADGAAGGNAVSSAAVSGGSVVSGSINGGSSSNNSGAGGTAAGSQAPVNIATNIGGGAGTSGAGGAGSTGAGGAARGPVAQTVFLWNKLDATCLRGVSMITAGSGGPGGGGGGGDGTAGGGGGGGGLGAGICFIWARNINTAGAVASAIRAKGGLGGNGFTSIAGQRGGGGGASGGGGGYIYIVYEAQTGSVANVLDVSGGTGGTGGNGIGAAGTGGDGGQGGSGGRVTLINAATLVLTENDGTAITGTAGSAHVTTTGGAGGAGAVARYAFP